MSDKCRWTLIPYREGSLVRVGIHNMECNSNNVSEIFDKWKYCPYCGRKIEEIKDL